MQNINDYLGGEFRRRNSDWRKLYNQLIPALPSELLEKIKYASGGDKVLTIYTDSAGWSAKLRFYESEILKSLKAQGRVFRTVQLKTLPDDSAAKRAATCPPPAG